MMSRHQKPFWFPLATACLQYSPNPDVCNIHQEVSTAQDNALFLDVLFSDLLFDDLCPGLDILYILERDSLFSYL